MTKKMLRILVVALALGGFVLAGCSDDSDSDEGSSESSESGASDDSAPDAGGESAEGDAVAIVDFAYDPEDLTVPAGTTVTFTNEDSATHTATADDDSFDTGDLEQGDSGEVTFDEAGEVTYFCLIHNYMTATITVE